MAWAGCLPACKERDMENLYSSLFLEMKKRHATKYWYFPYQALPPLVGTSVGAAWANGEKKGSACSSK